MPPGADTCDSSTQDVPPGTEDSGCSTQDMAPPAQTDSSDTPTQEPLYQSLDDMLSYYRQVTWAELKDKQEPWSKELEYN